MITKIELWRTDDGKDFNNEIEALRYENAQLRAEVDKLNWLYKCQPNIPCVPFTVAPKNPNDVSGVMFIRPSEALSWHSGTSYTGYVGDLADPSPYSNPY